MRLVVLNPVVVYGNGQGRVNLEIVRAALARGWHVTVVAAAVDPSLLEHPRLRWVPVSIGGWPTQLLRDQVFALRTALALRRLGSDNDVVLGNSFVSWARTNVNVAHFVHGGELHSPYYSYRRWWRSPYAAYQHLYAELGAHLERRVFAQAECVVAVSEKTAGELRQIGVAAEKIVVIHNGVDTDVFHPGPGDRARWRLPPSTPVFLFAGDLRLLRKGLDTVLQALTLAPGVHLAVAGSLQRSPFPRIATRLGVSDRVHWLGFERDMATLMRSVDGLAFPSRYESLSLLIMEAMASGVPVLTARTAGGVEILGAGGRVLEDPNDATTLARWMTELASTPDRRRYIGTAGREIALEHTWAHMTERYLDLIGSAKSSES